MAQSQIIGVSAPAKRSAQAPRTPKRERTFEDIRDARERWLRARRLCREIRVRDTALGFVCSLFDGGDLVAKQEGQTEDLAVEYALEEAGAL